MDTEIEKIHQGYINELVRRKYASSTITAYSSNFNKFMYHFKADFENITKQQILDWLLYLVEKDKISSAYQNHLINSIKFYYEQILGRAKEIYDIKRPRKEFKIPDLLTDEELQRLFNACTNIKHKVALSLLYGCGLRRSEVIHLKLDCITETYLRIVQSKGKKDRYVPLPENVANLIKQYREKYNPKVYLFNGQNGILQYSAESMAQFLNKYATEAGITKNVHSHLLRHNFITEHCEDGTNSMELMEIVGHSSPKTLKRYYHFRRPEKLHLKSPINKINL